MSCSFVNVGQGSCTIAIHDDNVWIIDAGSRSRPLEKIVFCSSYSRNEEMTAELLTEKILNYIVQRVREEVKMLSFCVSHFDSDHYNLIEPICKTIGALPKDDKVSKFSQVETIRIYTAQTAHNKETLRLADFNLKDKLGRVKIELHFVTGGTFFLWNSVKPQGKHTNPDEGIQNQSFKDRPIRIRNAKIINDIKKNNNSRSLLIQLTFDQNFKVLLTGDATSTTYGNVSLQSHVLSISHHGAGTFESTSLRLLGNVKPTHCVFSHHFASQYGHPHSDAIELVRLYFELSSRDSTLKSGPFWRLFQSNRWLDCTQFGTKGNTNHDPNFVPVLGLLRQDRVRSVTQKINKIGDKGGEEQKKSEMKPEYDINNDMVETDSDEDDDDDDDENNKSDDPDQSLSKLKTAPKQKAISKKEADTDVKDQVASMLIKGGELSNLNVAKSFYMTKYHMYQTIFCGFLEFTLKNTRIEVKTYDFDGNQIETQKTEDAYKDLIDPIIRGSPQTNFRIVALNLFNPDKDLIHIGFEENQWGKLLQDLRVLNIIKSTSTLSVDVIVQLLKDFPALKIIHGHYGLNNTNANPTLRQFQAILARICQSPLNDVYVANPDAEMISHYDGI